MAESEKTVLTVLSRGQVAAEETVHVNQKVKPMGVFYVLAGVAILIGMFWVLLTATVAPATSKPIPTLTLTAGPTRVNVELVMPGPGRGQATGLPAATAIPNPTFTPAPTLTVVPSMTPMPDIWLSVGSVAWPKKGWGRATTQSGLSPVAVDGWGAACPDDIPLGARLSIPGAVVLTCVDRAKGLACLDGICRILVFQSVVSVAGGLYPARLYVPKQWGVK